MLVAGVTAASVQVSLQHVQSTLVLFSLNFTFPKLS